MLFCFLIRSMYRAYTNKLLLKKPMKILRTQINTVFQTMLRLERCGRYGEAFAELDGIWEDVDALPDIEGLDSFDSAEMLLRCGSLIGFLGHSKQIPNTQERSKNLLTKAHRRFLDIYNVEKIVECENYLALAYWRTGEFVEAQTWLEMALSRHLRASTHVGIYSHLIQSMIFLSEGRYGETVTNLKKVEPDIKEYGDAFLNGSFCTNLGLAFQELGQLPEALKYMELAGYYHRKSGHQIYLGTVENNLAQLHRIKGNFAKAHEAIDRAAKIFKRLKDRTREGFSLDTKAQVYLADGKYEEALITVEAAIAIMQKSENLAYLVETYQTKTKSLVYLNDISAATLCLFDAMQIAKSNISEEAANNLAKEFEKMLHEKNSSAYDGGFTKTASNEKNLELILPPSIAHYQNVQGVWIKNTHLEKFGLPKNSLAIVVKEKIKRGDLVAISELADDSVSCGFYDADFGIVCLENRDNEPQLFDEGDIEILGKIVGVCSSGKNSEGQMIIKLLNFER